MVRLESNVGRQRSAFGRREDTDEALKIVAPAHRGQARVRRSPFGDDIDCSGGVEIAVLDEIGSFGDFYMVDCLRDQPVEIGISLTVGVIGQINGNAVDENGKVSPVVGIETSEKVFVRFPSAQVLHGIKTGNCAGENIDRRGRGAQFQVFLPNIFFRRRGNRFFAPDINFCRFRGGRLANSAAPGLAPAQLKRLAKLGATQSSRFAPTGMFPRRTDMSK